MWQLTNKDKAELIRNLRRQQLLVVTLRGHLYLVANRWQCAQKNMLLHTSNWWFHTSEKCQNRGNKRKKRENKSGNWEDLWSNEITIFQKKKNLLYNSRVWPFFLCSPIYNTGENQRQTTVKLTECESAAAQIDLRYCRWQRRRLVDYKEWLCQRKGKVKNKQGTHPLGHK